MIYTILAISGASLGFRAITGKNMIFYFLRKPFDKLTDRKKSITDCVEKATKEEAIHQKIIDFNIKKYGEEYKEKPIYSIHKHKIFESKTIRVMTESPNKYDWLIYIFKPIILCCTCMSSVHTFIWFYYLTGINPFTTWDSVLVVLIVAFLNSILFATYELITSLKEKA